MLQAKSLILLILLFVPLFDMAHGGSGNAGQPGEFLRYGIGARPLAMGGAFVGLADDLNSIYYNPAGLSSLTGLEFSFMHTKFEPDMYYNYIAAGHPDLFSGIGLGIAYVDHNMGKFDRRDIYDNPLGDFSLSEYAAYIALAKSLYRGLSAGASLKFIRQDFEGLKQSGSGAGLDLGVKLRHNFYLRKILIPIQLGICFQNILQPTLVAEPNEEKIPKSLDVGLSGQLIREKITIIGALAGHQVFSEDSMNGRFTMNLGGEFIWRADTGVNVAVRGGYRTDTRSVTFGVGVSIYLDNLKSIVGTNTGMPLYENGYSRFNYPDIEVTINPRWRARDAEYQYNQFDKVYSKYDSLDNDQKKSEQGRELKATMRRHLEAIIDQYPNEHVEEAAMRLAFIYDTGHDVHYLKLVDQLPLRGFGHSMQVQRCGEHSNGTGDDNSDE